MPLITRLIKEEVGQGMAEYAMMIMVLVVIAVMIGYQILGLNLENKVNRITENIQ